MIVPRIVHHVWPGADPFKPKFHSWRESWLRHHPDYTLKFWRTDDVLALKGKTELPASLFTVLEDPGYKATPKSDLMRFAILYLDGGIYTDTDMLCYRPFDPLFSSNQRVLAGLEDSKGTVCPSLLICEKGEPLMLEMVCIALGNIEKAGYSRTNHSPNHVTSVVPFTVLLRSKGITPLPKHYFYEISYKELDKLGNPPHPEAYARHYWSGTDPDGWVKMRGSK